MRNAPVTTYVDASQVARSAKIQKYLTRLSIRITDTSQAPFVQTFYGQPQDIDLERFMFNKHPAHFGPDFTLIAGVRQRLKFRWMNHKLRVKRLSLATPARGNMPA